MNLSYKVGWHCFRCLFTVWFRWRRFNPERVPPTGPVILACNHASYIDPPLAGAGVNRQISYLARQSLFGVPVLAAILRSWQVVPVDRDGGTGRGMRAILDRLERGGVIILFPEGTRTPDGRLRPARSGIGLAVIKSSAPVVPVRVFGTFEAYGKHLSWPRPRRLTVKYGRPLAFAALRAEAGVCSRPRLKEIYQQVADEIMAAIAQLEPREDPA
ncbi:MAG: lysophospholipid acyltransferase family protein [Verrucomicrobiota bacterium]|jgi:1-acyl-sn-glycerol-3-phosphate acyltransferase